MRKAIQAPIDLRKSGKWERAPTLGRLTNDDSTQQGGCQPSEGIKGNGAVVGGGI